MRGACAAARRTRSSATAAASPDRCSTASTCTSALPPLSVREIEGARRGRRQRQPCAHASRARASASAKRASARASRNGARSPLLELAGELEPSALRLLHRSMAAARAQPARVRQGARVARTIADLDASERVRVPHVAEAIQYRAVRSRAEPSAAERPARTAATRSSTRRRAADVATGTTPAATQPNKENAMSIKEKLKAVMQAIGSIEKQFGKGAIMSLGERTAEQVPAIPTGSPSLDRALGSGGYPRGRVVEIFGPESSGKTTLTLHAIAEAQRARRRGRVHRRRARARRAVREGARRRHRSAARQPARHRRAGARHRRDAGAQRRGRPGRGRLGRGARAQGRDRGRDGRPAHGPAGAADEPGAAQAHGRHAPHATPRSCSSTSCA